jgi:uncharacterized protein GlcG (DUF336 family)
VSVSVTERSGLPQLLIVGDGAGALSREVARRRAYTAVQLRVSTADFAKRVAGGGFNPAVFDTQLVTAIGGLPIKVGNDTIAAIGVCGAPGGERLRPARMIGSLTFSLGLLAYSPANMTEVFFAPLKTIV